MPFKDHDKKVKYTKEYNEVWYKKNRPRVLNGIKNRKSDIREWFADYKSKLKCKKCGYNKPPALDFHHNGNKDIALSEVINAGWCKERIIMEIKKCTVLCSNCHRVHHWKERQKKKKNKLH